MKDMVTTKKQLNRLLNKYGVCAFIGNDNIIGEHIYIIYKGKKFVYLYSCDIPVDIVNTVEKLTTCKNKIQYRSALDLVIPF